MLKSSWVRPSTGAGRDQPLAAPQELYLEVTNRCNLRCRTCPQFFGMEERFHDLSWERFLEITDQFPELKRVVLHGIGEPLLNPDLVRMIQHLKGRGAHVLFNSNGLLLRGLKARNLAASGLDELRISIDGGTPETYQAVRGVDGFGRILANLRRFVAARDALSLRVPRVSLWVTGMKTTIRDLPELVRVAAAHAIDDVYLQRLVYSERGLATRDESVFGRGSEEDQASVAEAMRLADELGITLRGSGELRPAEAIGISRAKLEGDGQAESAPWRDCHRPWRLMYITANGNALPCCIAPFTGMPYKDMILGDVAHQSVVEVWNGDAYRRWRAAMLSGEPPQSCAGCGVDWSL